MQLKWGNREVDKKRMQSRTFRELPRSDNERLIIGVLSPQLAASFFGGVLVGISKVAAQRGAAVIGIQTFDPGDADVDRAVSRYRRKAGWNHFAGVIALVDAVELHLLVRTPGCWDPCHLGEQRGRGPPMPGRVF